jgi:hypothetical protein
MLPLSRCDLDGGYGSELVFGCFGLGLCFASGAVWSALVVILVSSMWKPMLYHLLSRNLGLPFRVNLGLLGDH